MFVFYGTALIINGRNFMWIHFSESFDIIKFVKINKNKESIINKLVLVKFLEFRCRTHLRAFETCLLLPMITPPPFTRENPAPVP